MLTVLRLLWDVRRRANEVVLQSRSRSFAVERLFSDIHFLGLPTVFSRFSSRRPPHLDFQRRLLVLVRLSSALPATETLLRRRYTRVGPTRHFTQHLAVI